MTDKDSPVIIKDSSELILMKWKIELCNSGESCWCRLIAPEGNVQFERGVEAWIIPDGSVTKSEAEHIVKIHNEWLEAQNEQFDRSTSGTEQSQEADGG